MNKNIKKGMILTLFSSITLAALMLVSTNNVEASEYYSYSCGNNYEVSKITNNGDFQKVACYPDFGTAKKAMSEDESYVVRHSSSKSPTQIIAMNHGVAYSYPGRLNSATMYVYERSNLSSYGGNYKETYVSENYEMTYFDTVSYNASNGTGVIHVNLNGFDGYAELKATDLVPEQFLDTNLSLYIGGRNPYSGESAYEIKPIRNYYRVVDNDGVKELEFVNSISWPRYGLTPNRYVLTLDRAPLAMKEGVKYYSYNGYDFYSDVYFNDYVTTYYPYYQFLPLRSKSNLTAEDFDYVIDEVTSDRTALRNTGAYFKEAEEKYGVNALLLYAMAVHESGWGQSGYALNRNNLFGWEAYDYDEDQASSFRSVKDCVLEQAAINLRMFLDIDNWRFFSSSLGNKGSGLNVKYASDPYWGQKICAHAYTIDQIASRGGKLKDNGKYEMSLIDEFGASFYYEPSNKGERLYISNYGDNYQENFIVIPLGTEGDYTKFQFTNPIINKEMITIYTDGFVKYDFNQSVAYIKSSSLKPINQVIEYKQDYKITNLSLVEDKLVIEGYASTTNVVDEAAKVILIDDYGNKYPLKTTVDGEKINFNGEIDLTKLELGEYTFKVKVDYTDNKRNFKFDVLGDFENASYSSNKRKYTVTNNDLFTLNIEENDVESRNVISTNQLSLDEEGNVLISGFAFKSGYNYSDIDKISHVLELYDLVTGETKYSFTMNTEDSYGFGLNDGYNYKYVAYSGTFNVKDIELGHYGLRMNLTNDGNNFVFNLTSTALNHYRLNQNINDLTYILGFNQTFRYRLELDVMPKAFDYSLIKKPTISESVAIIDDLAVRDGKFIFDGAGFMKRVNQGVENNVEIAVSLLSDKGEIYETQTSKVESLIDYTKLFGKGFDLSDISFNSSLDVSELPLGTYEIMISLKTDEYYDLFALTDIRNFTYEGYAGPNKTYSVIVSKDRDRVHLVVEDTKAIEANINATVEPVIYE